MALYIQQILQGLDYLHRNNVANCRIGLRNVFVDENGECKLIDYGCNKQRMNPVAFDDRMIDFWNLGCLVLSIVKNQQVQFEYPIIPDYPKVISKELTNFLDECFKHNTTA